MFFYCLNALIIKSFLSNVYPTLQFKITILFVGFNSCHVLFFFVADVHTLILFIFNQIVGSKASWSLCFMLYVLPTQNKSCLVSSCNSTQISK